ncbi:hypothetical protein [Pseudescherichia vulneris]|uniref:hypothetical protein n=1 Tax=Pseudescherichia vulneris TaxID=566 RepID=UPI001EE05533|nr:hypothetical protein [Pseudescherichia vulneris]
MKTIHKTVFPDGRQGITIFSDPDIISEMVKLCKERNIHVNESPIIDEQFIQNLTKSVNDDLAIQKIEKMAEEINKKKIQTKSLTDVMVDRYLNKNKK